MSTENQVAGHYGNDQLEQGVFAALASFGKPLEGITPEDAAPLDEFHVGGLAATRELAAQLAPKPGARLLDVGSGLGGPARYLASAFGAYVTGVDLTPEFVKVARRLSLLMKLDHLTRFEEGSALNLPFEASQFDQAYMIHVGMNIADKAGVFHEVKRVLKPGGRFLIFDIMRTGPGEIQYPVPWAKTAATSFVGEIAEYKNALAQVGFQVESERVRREFGIPPPNNGAAGSPAVGLRLFAGEIAPVMARNITAMLTEGLLAPVELSMIAHQTA